MKIQQAVHRIPIRLGYSESGEWCAAPAGSVQELTGRVLGYRCAHCRYPDVPNHEDSDGFYWQSLDAVNAAGVLQTAGKHSASVPCGFTICQPDGTTRRIMHTASRSGDLTIEERAAILQAHGAPVGSVLLRDSELGLE